MQRNRKKCAAGKLSIVRLCAVGALLAAAVACRAPQETSDSVSDEQSAWKPAEQTSARACGTQGHLTTELYGAIAANVDWSASELECTGMPRPGGEGARLRFAGRTDDSRHIAIIIALPGLERDAEETEYPSTVTLIEEGSARFFNSADLNNCWTEIASMQAIGDSVDQFTIGGALYCVSPLAEVNGDSSVSISTLEFHGLLDWGAS